MDLLWIDGLTLVLVSLVLAFTDLWRVVETKALIIGEATNPNVVTDSHYLMTGISE